MVVKKCKDDKSILDKISLKNAKIDSHPHLTVNSELDDKETCGDFTIFLSSGEKHQFRATDSLERDQWIKSLRVVIKACSPFNSTLNRGDLNQSGNPLFETIFSQVHINDSSLQNQLTALASLDEMFKSELNNLSEIVLAVIEPL